MLYFLVLVYWFIVVVMKNNVDFILIFGFWFVDWNFDINYDSLMSWMQGLFWWWVGNLMLYFVSVGVIGILFVVMVGYVIVKFVFLGKCIVVGVIMVGFLFFVVLLIVLLYIEFYVFGLMNMIWVIIIFLVVFLFGVFFGMVYVQLLVLIELLEVVCIDGVGEVWIFFMIVLWFFGLVMVMIFLFIFVVMWNNFFFLLMMILSQDLKFVIFGFYGMVSYFFLDKGVVMFGVLLGVIFFVLFFFILQKYWCFGFVVGVVKG